MLNKFSKISGYKLNFYKRELFPTSSLVNNRVHSLLTDVFMYLGMFVIKSLNGTYASNFALLLRNRELSPWLDI